MAFGEWRRTILCCLGMTFLLCTVQGSSEVRAGSIWNGVDIEKFLKGPVKDLPVYVTMPHDLAEVIESDGAWLLDIGRLGETEQEARKDKDYVSFLAKSEGTYTFRFYNFQPLYKRRKRDIALVYFECWKIAKDTHSVLVDDAYVTLQTLSDLNNRVTQESFVMQEGERLYIRVLYFNCEKAKCVMQIIH